jgi:nicotinate-nucleotide pyrophosphorylase (carboxylating)
VSSGEAAWRHPEIVDAVRRALAEDVGSGDVTCRAVIPETAGAKGRFYARQPMTVAGVELLPIIYEVHGGAIDELASFVQSGDRVEAGTALARVAGNARTLLECERTALNFVQRLSGVATLARRMVDAVAGTGVTVLDTRKTTPGLRRVEKLAAAAGGVQNHRMGLWDAILIKNNHITFWGSVTETVKRALASGLPVEVEVRTRAELDEALAAGAGHLLLDNLTPAEAREWIAYIGGRAKTELSGNITLETIRGYAETGPDYISSGAITHSAIAANCNFRLEWTER